MTGGAGRRSRPVGPLPLSPLRRIIDTDRCPPARTFPTPRSSGECAMMSRLRRSAGLALVGLFLLGAVAAAVIAQDKDKDPDKDKVTDKDKDKDKVTDKDKGNGKQ